MACYLLGPCDEERERPLIYSIVGKETAVGYDVYDQRVLAQQ